MSVLTGHGGSFTSKFIKDNLSSIMTKKMTQLCTPEDNDHDDILDIASASVASVLESSFIASDKLLAAEPRMRVKSKINPPRRGQAVENEGETGSGTHVPPVELVTIDNSGSTACVCFVGPSDLVTANIGDSRAVLAQWHDTDSDTDSKVAGICAVDLSNDHKPNLENETIRIKKAGCRLIRIKI